MHRLLKRRSSRGFTLVEIMVVVVIIGLLVAIALPAFRKVRMNSQNSRFISDLRTFSGAIETYLLAEGDYPDNGQAGELPPGLDAYIKPSDFEPRSPIGGNWRVVVDEGDILLAVGVVGTQAPMDQLLQIDKQIDDGVLTTGKLQQFGDGGIFWVIED